ncbi:helix-turn-helix domain-containing protein [Burkholderia anthina]|uniref:helix-turn-helix domain-containing protein n=1 Tax=Burkholderia anthina TaxID=179879 RepID=UPI001589A57E|nr:helix-turn-helix domain-containing protein [Burkholderia anthina]MBY4869033.1 helix-turn-helix domain-containing protein [Burkholderia anthina]
MEKAYILTMAQAARRLGVSYPTLRQWAVRGDLPCRAEQHEEFCARTFNDADLDAFAARRAAERSIGADELTTAQAAHIVGQRWPGAASMLLKAAGVPFRKIGAPRVSARRRRSVCRRASLRRLASRQRRAPAIPSDSGDGRAVGR